MMDKEKVKEDIELLFEGQHKNNVSLSSLIVLLIDKNIITRDELLAEIKETREEIIKE